ncbi:serine hydrolase domain-containing protein [Microterricola viridarii]|uniref:CubicO group peptidase, beta-lactamase class C family n=1 Tax=Microterricola viridarii TaxID=412690 RepID=A0A1H1V2F3_9MICO|nr:serine hydrolase domain-containing protein [Microterricola viridarii]SDS78556.1 CubicO group peptidase, beta-lactamase class C family [Microterricola viridarii]
MSDALFEEHLARGAAPAAAWGLFDADGLRHARQSGVAADTAFRIASCTKSFTAAALLGLRDDGLLGLDDPITRAVPGLSLAGLPSAGSAVPTVRMLLTMSSGLPTDDPWADRQEAMTAAEFDAPLAAGVRFEAEPGTRFAYSNLGYALLGRVIEVVSGQSYQSFVAERLLTPLGLASTGFDASVAAPGGVAVGHRRHAGAWEPLPFTGPGAFSAIGGLFSTVSDLARWAGWLASAFDADADDAVLSAASRREMQQLHRLDQTVTERPTGYGYGLFVEQYSPRSRVVSHSGGYPGFSAHMRWSLEQRLGVVAFSNATYSRVSATATAALDALLAEREAAASAPVPELWPETRAAQTAVTELLATWAGGGETPLDPALFSENVALDLPLERRTAALRLALADIGGLTAGSPTDACSDGPAHLAWFLPGASGRLRVEIRLTPEARPRVQTLLVAVDRAGR